MSFGRRDHSSRHAQSDSPWGAAQRRSQFDDESGIGRSHIRPIDDRMAAKVEAFIAEERARSTAKLDSLHNANYAAQLPDIAQAASRRSSAGLDAPLWTGQYQSSPASTGSYAHRGGRTSVVFGQPKDRSLAFAYVLWFFAHGLALHRFYLGATRSAVMQMGLIWIGWLTTAYSSSWLTFDHLPGQDIYNGMFGVSESLMLMMVGVTTLVIGMAWHFVDLFLMPGLHRKLKQREQSLAELTSQFS